MIRRAPSTMFRARRPAMVLLVVLVMVALLALLAASYSFMVNANLKAAMTEHYQFQAHMAAESGLQQAVAVLREARNDPGTWYSNPALFRAVMVEGIDEQETEDENAALPRSQTVPAWRVNLVAPNYEDPTTIRYGLTDECARLDLNLATDDQMRRLFELVIPQDTTNPVDVSVLVDSLFDWRESGDLPRANGAKDEYYLSLDPPYRCKKNKFATIEELLLVRGFTAWVVFGEDYNQNGLLDPNEDDGDVSFPPDNADGMLYAGIAPFLTLWAREANVSHDQRPRINLNMPDLQKLQEALSEEFRQELVNYVMQIRAGGPAFNSVMNLLPAPPPPEEEPTTQPATSAPSDLLPPTSQPTSQPSDGLDAGLSPEAADSNQSTQPSENTEVEKLPVFKDLTDTVPPGTYEDLPLILERLTVQPVPLFAGRININTAPRAVLATLKELSEEELNAIFAARAGLAAEERSNAAWLLRNNVISEYTFRRILDKLAANAAVFRAEAVGYADHLNVVDRFSVVFEMRGPVPQVLYHRSLNALGMAYTPQLDEIRSSKQAPR